MLPPSDAGSESHNLQAGIGAREELSLIAAAVRAYLEWQEDTGAVGIPRRPKGEAPSPRTGEALATFTSAHEDAMPGAIDSPLPTSTPRVLQASHALASAPQATPNHALISPPQATPNHASHEAPAIANTALSPPAPVHSPPSMGASTKVEEPPHAHRSLSTIQTEASACTKCALSSTRRNVVFSRGNPASKLFFIGEAPGADEDAQGIPFVGRAGQLLDKMIGAMGLDPHNDVYVANILKCRPPNNRRPEPAEVETCIPYLHEQIQAVDPRVIVALGNTAVSALLGTTLGITKVRGQWKLYRGRIPVMPTYHPSYLLRPSPQQLDSKRQAWEDLQSVMKELGLKPPR